MSAPRHESDSHKPPADAGGAGGTGVPPVHRPEACATTPALIAWASFDASTNGYAAVIQTFIFAAYFTSQVAVDEQTGTTQWGLTIGIAGLTVALGGPLLGAMADQTGRRKPWLVAFLLLGVVGTALLWFVRPSPEYLWLAIPFVYLATVGIEKSNIFYNSMLPALAPAKHIGRWSGWGWSAGYAGGLACLILALVLFVHDEWAIFTLPREEAQHVRASFLLVAVWSVVFALPLLLFTPDTPAGKPLRQAAGDGVRQLVGTFRRIREYRQIAHFLIARIFYTDGLVTLFAFGGIFAATQFAMEAQQVLMLGILLNVTAGIGALTFSWIDDWIGPKATILIALSALIVSTTTILLTHSEALFWTLAAFLGFFVGPAQAASRSFLSRVAPPKLRAEMFGLFALSGKATAFVGPMFVGLITYLAESQRLGMSVIVLYFIIGFIGIATVQRPGEVGRQDESDKDEN